MPETKSTNALSVLDPSVCRWIQSDSVFETIVTLNKELGCFGEELSVISQLVISISLREVKPEDLSKEIFKGLPFLEEKQVEHAGEVMKKKIFGPFAPGFKKIGVDVDKLVTKVPPPPVPVKPAEPVAREVKLEPKPISRPQVNQPPVSQQKPIERPVEPKAREMNFAQMTDVKKPIQPKTPINAKPAENKPDVFQVIKPFGLSESIPQAPKENKPAPLPKPATAPAPMPKPTPAQHDVVQYHDEHPMKEQ